MVKLLAGVVFVLLIAAGPARAEVSLGRAPYVGPIQLSGPAVIYQDETFDTEDVDTVEYTDRIVRRRPGHRAKVLETPSSTLESNFGEGVDELRWDASSNALLTGVGSSDYEGSDVRLSARIRGGLLGGDPFTLKKCGEDADGKAPAVSVWGTLAAYTNVCGEGRLFVRDLAHPDAAPLYRTDVDENAIDLAGDYVAFVQYQGRKPGIAVYNWRTGAPLYSVTGPLYDDEETAGTFDLQPDGKLAAVLFGLGDSCDAVWYSPAEPRAHVVGKTDCGSDIRLRSDRLAWMRIGKRHGALVVTPLGGAGRAVASFPALPPTSRGVVATSSTTAGQEFAWDGRRLAYSIAGCDSRSAVLLRRRVEGPVHRDRAPVTCPFRVPSHVLRVKRGGHSVRLPLRCPRGCAGWIDIRRSKTRSAGILQPFALGRHGTGTRVYLYERTRAALARRGTARMRISLDVPGRLGGGGRDVVLRLYAR